MMLDDLGCKACAQTIRNALDQVFAQGEVLTPDLGGNATTTEFVAAIKENLNR